MDVWKAIRKSWEAFMSRYHFILGNERRAMFWKMDGVETYLWKSPSPHCSLQPLIKIHG